MPCDISVTRWTLSQTPRAERLSAMLVEEGLEAHRWSNRPGDRYPTHSHDFHKVIYVLAGSITIGLPGCGENIRLEGGDRLDLPAGIRHDVLVGSRGVVCLEAHRAS